MSSDGSHFAAQGGIQVFGLFRVFLRSAIGPHQHIMPKRQAEDAEIHQSARAKGEGKQAEDGGMGEFEDQWEDEMSEEEVVEGDLEGEDGECGRRVKR